MSETTPSGWDLTGTVCVSSISDTESAGSLELDAGETITCTFTNTLEHVQFGKTMGFWGNNNGLATILSEGGYAANPVNIGRGAIIDDQAESLKVLPSTLNACGMGTTTIFSDQTDTLTTRRNLPSSSGIPRQHLFLEVFGEPVVGHLPRIVQTGPERSKAAICFWAVVPWPLHSLGLMSPKMRW